MLIQAFSCAQIGCKGDVMQAQDTAGRKCTNHQGKLKQDQGPVPDFALSAVGAQHPYLLGQYTEVAYKCYVHAM